MRSSNIAKIEEDRRKLGISEAFSAEFFAAGLKEIGEDASTQFSHPLPDNVDTLNNFLQSADGHELKIAMQEILTELKDWAESNGLHFDTQIESYKKRFIDNTEEFTNQSLVFVLYAQGVPLMEKLNKLLKNEEIPLLDRCATVNNLLEEFDKCGPGIFSRIQTSVINLEASLNVNILYSEFRRKICQQVIGEIIANMFAENEAEDKWLINEGNEIHYQNAVQNVMSIVMGLKYIEDGYSTYYEEIILDENFLDRYQGSSQNVLLQAGQTMQAILYMSSEFEKQIGEVFNVKNLVNYFYHEINFADKLDKWVERLKENYQNSDVVFKEIEAELDKYGVDKDFAVRSLFISEEVDWVPTFTGISDVAVDEIFATMQKRLLANGLLNVKGYYVVTAPSGIEVYAPSDVDDIECAFLSHKISSTVTQTKSVMALFLEAHKNPYENNSLQKISEDLMEMISGSENKNRQVIDFLVRHINKFYIKAELEEEQVTELNNLLKTLGRLAAKNIHEYMPILNKLHGSVSVEAVMATLRTNHDDELFLQEFMKKFTLIERAHQAGIGMLDVNAVNTVLRWEGMSKLTKDESLYFSSAITEYAMEEVIEGLVTDTDLMDLNPFSGGDASVKELIRGHLHQMLTVMCSYLALRFPDSELGKEMTAIRDAAGNAGADAMRLACDAINKWSKADAAELGMYDYEFACLLDKGLMNFIAKIIPEYLHKERQVITVENPLAAAEIIIKFIDEQMEQEAQLSSERDYINSYLKNCHALFDYAEQYDKPEYFIQSIVSFMQCMDHYGDSEAAYFVAMNLARLWADQMHYLQQEEQIHSVYESYKSIDKYLKAHIVYHYLKENIEDAAEAYMRAVDYNNSGKGANKVTSHQMDVLNLALLEIKDIDHVDEDTLLSPLMVAVLLRSPELVTSVIDYGADVDVLSGQEKVTALWRAAEMGSLEMVKALYEKGASLDACDKYSGDTPLHVALKGAVHSGDFRVVEFLLDNGAAHDAVNFFGVTPLDIARLHEVDEYMALAGLQKNEASADRLMGDLNYIHGIGGPVAANNYHSENADYVMLSTIKKFSAHAIEAALIDAAAKTMKLWSQSSESDFKCKILGDYRRLVANKVRTHFGLEKKHTQALDDFTMEYDFKLADMLDIENQAKESLTAQMSLANLLNFVLDKELNFSSWLEKFEKAINNENKNKALELESMFNGSLTAYGVPENFLRKHVIASAANGELYIKSFAKEELTIALLNAFRAEGIFSEDLFECEQNVDVAVGDNFDIYTCKQSPFVDSYQVNCFVEIQADGNELRPVNSYLIECLLSESGGGMLENTSRMNKMDEGSKVEFWHAVFNYLDSSSFSKLDDEEQVRQRELLYETFLFQHSMRLFGVIAEWELPADHVRNILQLASSEEHIGLDVPIMEELIRIAPEVDNEHHINDIVEVFRELAEAGNLNDLNTSQIDLCLHLTLAHGSEKLTNALLDAKVIDKERVQDAFSSCVNSCMLSGVQYLIDKDQTFDWVNLDGKPILEDAMSIGEHYVSRRDIAKMFLLLLNKDSFRAYQEHTDHKEPLPYRLCAKLASDCIPVLDRLFEMDCIDVNMRNQDGTTMLQSALEVDDFQLAEYLLAKGARLDPKNAPDKEAYRGARMSFVKWGRHDLVEQLDQQLKTGQEKASKVKGTMFAKPADDVDRHDDAPGQDRFRRNDGQNN